MRGRVLAKDERCRRLADELVFLSLKKMVYVACDHFFHRRRLKPLNGDTARTRLVPITWMELSRIDAPINHSLFFVFTARSLNVLKPEFAPSHADGANRSRGCDIYHVSCCIRVVHRALHRNQTSHRSILQKVAGQRAYQPRPGQWSAVWLRID
jgi:hypothetical protein